MQENKIKTYLGFARRAGKLALGVNAAKCVRGRVYLLVMDSAASPNSKKEIESLRKRFSCPLIAVENLEELTGKSQCRLAAVREEHLAQAILQTVGIEEQSQGGTD